EAHGYQVVTAGSGQEALARFSEHREQMRLVLTDMMMPGLDGPATIRGLREISPRIPVITVSGLPANRDEPDANAPAVQGFLQKPFTAEQLLQSIREVLDKC